MKGFDIGGFTPFTLTDYPGKVAAIVFTQGCNLACPFCHNKSLIPINKKDSCLEDESLDGLFDFLASRKGKLQGVVVTGGEPTIQTGLKDFLKRLKELGLEVKLDTNGTNPEALGEVIGEGLVDFIAMDIKAPWEKYDKVAGKSVDVSSLKESVELILSSGLECQFRTTFVPSLLTPEDLAEIRAYLPEGINYQVQKFVQQS